MSWDVVKAEERIQSVLQAARLIGNTHATSVLSFLTKAHGNMYYDAANEMHEVIENTEHNPTNYHLNTIKSGTYEYMVISENGEMVASFATEEEAKDVFPDDKYLIVSCDPNEMWVVLDKKTHHNVCNMLFPTMSRALAFLYHMDTPPAYSSYWEKKGVNVNG